MLNTPVTSTMVCQPSWGLVSPIKRHVIRLIFLALITLAFPLRADLAKEVETLREAYAATNSANFAARLAATQSAGVVIRYQWKSPDDNFVFRRQDVTKIGRSDFENPDAIDQSSRWNQNGFFLIVGKKAIKSSISDLDWLPKYDFNWITRITTRSRDFNGIPCSELRVEVKLPNGTNVSVLYWIDRDRPFIRGYEVLDDQDGSVKKFDFGSVTFDPPLSSRMFRLPQGVSTAERKSDRPLAEQLFRGNDSPQIRQLQNAFDRTLASSYTAVLTYCSEKHDKVTYHIYQKSVAGQRFPLVRKNQVEFIGQKSMNTASHLSNAQGSFVFYGSDVVKSKFSKIDVPPYMDLPALQGAKVAEKQLPDGDISYTLRLPVPDGFDSKTFPVLRRYYVRPDIGFIHAWEAFTSAGKMVYRYELADVRFDPEYPSGIFDLPDWPSMHKSEDLESIRKNFYNRMANSAAPGWIQRQYDATLRFFDRNLDSILTWGGRVAFWLAIAIITLIVILKVRSRVRGHR